MKTDKIASEPGTRSLLCPSCGHKGIAVKPITIESLLTEEAKDRVSRTHGFRFVPTQTCEVSYFHPETQEQLLLRDVRVRIGQKEKEAPHPICYCFNHTVEEIEAEVAKTGTSRIPDEITEKCRQGLDRCAQTNPQGSCCLGNVRRVLKAAQAKFDTTSAGIPSSMQQDARRTTDCCAIEPAKETQDEHGQKVGLWATGGAVISAILSSACCWLPFLLIAFGASAAGVSGFFEAYRYYFLMATGLFLTGGFYLIYFRRQRCAPDSACTVPNVRLNRFNKIMLWVATAVILLFALFPNYLGMLLGSETNNRAPVVTLGEGRHFRIDGMTCAGCATALASHLTKVPGVARVEVSHQAGTAHVFFDPKESPPSNEQILKAITERGFHGMIED